MTIPDDRPGPRSSIFSDMTTQDAARASKTAPFATGWYLVSFSADLPPSGVVPLRYFAKDLVLYRVGTLYGIAGTPASAFIVGEGGAIFRSDAATEQRIACSEHADLRGVVLDGAGAVAVGDGGVIVRITDAGCVVERPFSATVRDLYAVAPGPNGRLLAVGESGTALERTDAGTWEPYELDAGGYDLHRIVTTDRDIFVIGAGGVVLRHPRIVTGPRP